MSEERNRALRKELEQTSLDLDYLLQGFREEIVRLRKEGRPELANELEREVRNIELQRAAKI